MSSIDFHYKKIYYLICALVCLFLLGFLAVFIYEARGLYNLPNPNEMTYIMQGFFTFLYVAMGTFLLTIVINYMGKVLSSAPAISIDKEGITLEGRRHFLWSELEYVAYKTHHSRSEFGEISRIDRKTDHLLIIKPFLRKRKIKFNITLIKGAKVDIFLAIRSVAPDLPIKDWEVLW